MVRTVLQAFATVFPAELPDKSMVASIALVARYRRPRLVWAGAAAAFAVHVVVAVAAGSAIGLLPDALVSSVVATLFLLGAVVLFRAGRSAHAAAHAPAAGEVGVPEPVRSAWSVVAASFGVLVLAEWGDLTQLATASLAARSPHPVATGMGAWLALAAVAAIAATFGRQLVTRLPIHRVNFVGAAVFAALGAWTLFELAT